MVDKFELVIGDSVDSAIEGLYYGDKQILDYQELKERYNLDVYDLCGFSNGRLQRFGKRVLFEKKFDY